MLKDFNFLYWIFRPFIVITWKVYYRYHVRNRKNLKFNKPTLIIANHSNSVIDPVAIATIPFKGVYFLPRGDVFNSPFKKWLLWQFHMIPIFRKEEGKENMHKNEETFRRVYGLFNKRKPVIIFSEGLCVQEKRMRTFRKGTARMAFEYDEIYRKGEELQFLPVGLNYHHWNKFNSDLCINIGKPFTLTSIGLSGRTDKAKAINEFNAEAEKRLKDLMVILEPQELDGLEIDLEEIYEEELLKDFQKNNNSRENEFLFRKKCADALSEFYKKEKERVLALKQAVSEYQQNIKKLGFRDRMMKKGNKAHDIVFPFLILLISSPLLIPGLITNFLPYRLPILIANKKIKIIEFYATVVSVLSFILFFIWYSIFYIFISIYIDSFIYGLIAWPVLVLLGWFTYKWWRFWQITGGKINYNNLLGSNPEVIHKLQKQREIIIGEFEYFRKNYLLN